MYALFLEISYCCFLRKCGQLALTFFANYHTLIKMKLIGNAVTNLFPIGSRTSR